MTTQTTTTPAVSPLMEIALRIREMRRITGFTEKEMAEKTGVTEAEYRSYETGTVDLPFTFLHKCSLAFGLELTDLLEGQSAKLSSYSVTRRGCGLITAAEDGITIRNLAAPNTGCLHDYQLSTGDMKVLNKADVFLINGAGMESYLTRVMDTFPKLPVVDASTGITLLTEDGMGEYVDDHDHDHEEEDADDHGHHHAGEANAHIWLDAQNAIQMVDNLADGLISAMPQYEAQIEQNRADYVARLTALDEELKETLAAVPNKNIVTFHEAFPYFARAYGLTVAAVVNHEPGDALSPAQLAELVRTIRELNNPPLFTEPQYDDMAAQTISRETGAPIYTLDPVVTGPETDVPLTYYEDRMRENMQTLLVALTPAEGE